MKACTKKISQSLAAACSGCKCVSMMAMAKCRPVNLNDIRNDVFQVVNSGLTLPFVWLTSKAT